jgi:cytochrome P450
MVENHDEHVRMGKDKARRRIDRGSLGRYDFFDHLIKNGTLTEDALMGNADTLIIAGSETTATALTGLTWYLLNNPSCLRQLTDEIREAFRCLDDITGDSTAELPYLHGCIEEGLRVFPPLAFGLPRDCPGAVIDGHFVPEGTVVANENYSMSLDPRYWVDPMSFRPERWIGEGFAGDDKRAFQPFSSGPRGCLGVNLAYLEMRISVAKLLWAFDLESASEIQDWNSACKNHILWKKPDLNVRFHPRWNGMNRRD